MEQHARINNKSKFNDRFLERSKNMSEWSGVVIVVPEETDEAKENVIISVAMCFWYWQNADDKNGVY